MAIFVPESKTDTAAPTLGESGCDIKRPDVLRRPPVLKESTPAAGVIPAGRKLRQPPIFGAAAKAPEFSDRMRYHYRETRRINIDIPCSVEVVEPDGTIYDSGTATVVNVSPSGALLNSFQLERGSFPSAGFKLRLVLKGEPYTGIGIEATPVRIADGGGIGLKFNEIFVAV